VIDLGEGTEGLYSHKTDDFRGREHILFLFRHIDRMEKVGPVPPREEFELHTLNASQLVDVIVGKEVTGEEGETRHLSEALRSTHVKRGGEETAEEGDIGTKGTGRPTMKL